MSSVAIWILMLTPSCVLCSTFTDKYSLSQGNQHTKVIWKCHIIEKQENGKKQQVLYKFNNYFLRWTICHRGYM